MPAWRDRLGRFSLAAWLAVAFSVLSLLLTLSLTLLSDRAASGNVREGIGANLAGLAQQTASRLDRSMAERYRELQLLAQRLPAASDAAAARQALDAVQQSYPLYAWIGLTDHAGVVRSATGGALEGVDVSSRPWYRHALDGQPLGEVHDIEPLGTSQGRATPDAARGLDLAFPVRDMSGQPVGMLGALLSWRWADDVQAAVFGPVQRQRHIELLIVSNDGTVLLGPAGTVGTVLQLPSLAAAGRGESGHAREPWPDGETYLVGYSSDSGLESYPGMDWRVLVRQTLDEAYAPVDSLHRRLLLGGAVAALLFSLLGWWVARWITRPLHDLTGVARGIEAGYAVKAPATSAYREVSLLGNALNSLVASLQAQEAELRHSHAALERRVSERTAELRETVADLRANEERVQTVIDTAQEAFIGMDFDGVITDWNDQAEALFGWKRFEVLGQSLADTILPERFQTAFVMALAHFDITGEAPFAGQLIRRTVMDRHGKEMQVAFKVSLINTPDVKLFSAFLRPVSEDS